MKCLNHPYTGETLETCYILCEFTVCMACKRLWPPSTEFPEIGVFLSWPHVPWLNQRTSESSTLWGISVCGYVARHIQALTFGRLFEERQKILVNTPYVSWPTLNGPVQCQQVTSSTGSGITSLLPVPPVPGSDTAPAATGNKTALKTFSINATFIRAWNEMTEAWSATIKFHIRVFQKTMHLS